MHPPALPALLDGAEAHRDTVRIDHRIRGPMPASARNEAAWRGERFRDAWSAAGSGSTRAGLAAAPLSVSAPQITAFAAIRPQYCRPVQPLGERVLYRG